MINKKELLQQMIAAIKDAEATITDNQIEFSGMDRSSFSSEKIEFRRNDTVFVVDITTYRTRK